MTRSLLSATALTWALAILAAPAASQGTSATSAPKAITTLGCYNTAASMVSQGDYTFQTSGWCQGICVGLDKAIMAITGGSTCYCGDELPPTNAEVSESKCDSPCNGFDQQTCGGLSFWQVYLTGLSADVQTAPNSTSSSSSGSSPTSTQPSVVTKAGETVVITASSAANKGSPGNSKVGIAVGVVVGVLGLAAIVGGVLLFLRRKRNREIEEEHRKNAAISSFVGSQKSNSATDQRLDPSVYSHGRQSIGSIADERDFSRRILQVRNPDRESKQSSFA